MKRSAPVFIIMHKRKLSLQAHPGVNFRFPKNDAYFDSNGHVGPKSENVVEKALQDA
jgi:hypothetical protein